MLDADSVYSSSRVLSVRDIDYPLKADYVFHPAFLNASIRRISAMDDEVTREIVAAGMLHPSAKKVWAVVFESNNEPVLVVKNLAFTKVKLPYRRVLRIQTDNICFSEQYIKKQMELYEQEQVELSTSGMTDFLKKVSVGLILVYVLAIWYMFKTSGITFPKLLTN